MLGNWGFRLRRALTKTPALSSIQAISPRSGSRETSVQCFEFSLLLFEADSSLMDHLCLHITALVHDLSKIVLMSRAATSELLGAEIASQEKGLADAVGEG